MSESLHRFSIGRDTSIVLIGPYGRVDLSGLTEFEAKQRTTTTKSEPLNAPPMEAAIPMGWEGTIKCDRTNPGLEILAAAMESEFWDGAGTVRASTLFEFTRELDGSETRWQYEGVTLHLSDAGSRKTTNAVSQTISFFARRRRKI